MSSNKPVTYDELFDQLSTRPRNTKLPLREGTWAEWSMYPSGIDLMLHGNLLATVFTNKAVRLSEKHFVSLQCRNRMNDLLIPIGWKIKMDNGAWFLFHEKTGSRVEYRAGQMVVPLEDDGTETEL